MLYDCTLIRDAEIPVTVDAEWENPGWHIESVHDDEGVPLDLTDDEETSILRQLDDQTEPYDDVDSWGEQ